MELLRAVVLLLDPVALPHVLIGDVGSLLALVGGLELAGGELRCCCCALQSTAALVDKSVVVVQAARAHITLHQKRLCIMENPKYARKCIYASI